MALPRSAPPQQVCAIRSGDLWSLTLCGHRERYVPDHTDLTQPDSITTITPGRTVVSFKLPDKSQTYTLVTAAHEFATDYLKTIGGGEVPLR